MDLNNAEFTQVLENLIRNIVKEEMTVFKQSFIKEVESVKNNDATEFVELSRDHVTANFSHEITTNLSHENFYDLLQNKK